MPPNIVHLRHSEERKARYIAYLTGETKRPTTEPSDVLYNLLRFPTICFDSVGRALCCEGLVQMPLSLTYRIKPRTQ